LLQNNPLIARLFPKLIYQLVPAALVTGVGILLLSNLAKAPSAARETVPAAVAINAEAVFTATPQEPAKVQAAEPAAATRPAVKPKAVAANAATPSRKPANESAAPRQVASVPAPLPTVQIPGQPVVAEAATAPSSETGVMSKLRSATAKVQQLPQWAASSVAGWFSEETPPRPPASVPVENVQASM
jgi:hypothetical protein